VVAYGDGGLFAQGGQRGASREDLTIAPHRVRS
jgi:hypothetical protein